MAESLGIHVTGGLLKISLAEPLLAMTHCLPDPVTTPPGSWLTGGSNHAGSDWPNLYCRGRNIVTGHLLPILFPNFVAGIMGQPFQTPFAKPPNKGLSSPTVNVLWSFLMPSSDMS